MTYILKIMSGEKFLITKEQKDCVMQALNAGEKVIEINDEVVPLSPVPSIVRFERWFAQENERLRLTGRRLCKFCFSVMEIESGCGCWEQNGSKQKNAFFLPAQIMESLQIKSFPLLSEVEKAEIEQIVDEPKLQYIDVEGEINGYIDKETGEERYS